MKGTIDFDSKFDQVITTVGDLKESSTFLVSLRENIMNAIEKQYEEVERLLHNKYKVSNYVTNGVHNHELPTWPLSAINKASGVYNIVDGLTI